MPKLIVLVAALAAFASHATAATLSVTFSNRSGEGITSVTALPKGIMPHHVV